LRLYYTITRATAGWTGDRRMYWLDFADCNHHRPVRSALWCKIKQNIKKTLVCIQSYIILSHVLQQAEPVIGECIGLISPIATTTDRCARHCGARWSRIFKMLYFVCRVILYCHTCCSKLHQWPAVLIAWFYWEVPLAYIYKPTWQCVRNCWYILLQYIQ
jgi:hypothetical protein